MAAEEHTYLEFLDSFHRHPIHRTKGALWRREESGDHELVQHHLQRLPPAIQQQYHAWESKARSLESAGKWEDAADHYAACIDVLDIKQSRVDSPPQTDLYALVHKSWLTFWAGIPLASICQLNLHNYRRSLLALINMEWCLSQPLIRDQLCPYGVRELKKAVQVQSVAVLLEWRYEIDLALAGALPVLLSSKFGKNAMDFFRSMCRILRVTWPWGILEKATWDEPFLVGHLEVDDVFEFLLLQCNADGQFREALRWNAMKKALFEKLYTGEQDLEKADRQRQVMSAEGKSPRSKSDYLYGFLVCRLREVEMLNRLGESEKCEDILREVWFYTSDPLLKDHPDLNLCLARTGSQLLKICSAKPFDDEDARGTIKMVEEKFEKLDMKLTPGGGLEDESLLNLKILQYHLEKGTGTALIQDERYEDAIAYFEDILRQLELLETKSEVNTKLDRFECIASLGFCYAQLYRSKQEYAGHSRIAYSHYKQAVSLATGLMPLSHIAYIHYHMGVLLAACARSALQRVRETGHSGLLDIPFIQRLKGDVELWDVEPLKETSTYPILLMAAEQHYKRSANLNAEILQKDALAFTKKDSGDFWARRLNVEHLRAIYDSLHILPLNVRGYIVMFMGGLEMLKKRSTQVQLDCGTITVSIADELVTLLDQLSTKSLLWAERGRTRSLMYQLQPALTSKSIKSLLEFDLDDKVAWNAIKSSQAACGEGAVFVQYTYVDGDNSTFKPASRAISPFAYAYVISDSQREEERWDHVFTLQTTEHKLVPVLERFYNFIRQSQEEEELDESQALMDLEYLHEILLQPLASVLPSKPEEKLVFAPSGILTNVPFALLRDKRQPMSKKFLIQRHTISITPSLRVLGLCQQRLSFLTSLPMKNEAPAGTVIGDPAYSDSRSRLAGTGREVNLIASCFGDKNVVNLQGTAATVKSLLGLIRQASATNCSQAFIHLATHGHVNRRFPKGALELADPDRDEWPPSDSGDESDDDDEDSSLGRGSAEDQVKDDTFEKFKHLSTLANIKQEIDPTSLELDGSAEHVDSVELSVFGEVGGVRGAQNESRTETHTGTDWANASYLRSEDIVACQFDWRAHMVILSACNSGKGEVLAEGVLNLPRALMVAGIPCTIMSQWLVHDESAPELMAQFYTNMRMGDDVSTALRSVMLGMIEKRMKMNQWGAFAVWGLPTVCLPSQLQWKV